MGGVPANLRMAERPEVLLAQHVEECLGVHVEPDALLKFVTENWMTVQTLAHRIHNSHVLRKHAERTARIMREGV